MLPLPIEKAIRYITIANINDLLCPITLSKKKEGKQLISESITKNILLNISSLLCSEDDTKIRELTTNLIFYFELTVKMARKTNLEHPLAQ